MAKNYSVSEARARLPEILEDVEAGKEVHLTRRGKPVAVVVSTDRFEAMQKRRIGFMEAHREFMKTHSPEDIALEPGYFESLRDRSPGRDVKL